MAAQPARKIKRAPWDRRPEERFSVPPSGLAGTGHN
jgi:hypothetical protein